MDCSLPDCCIHGILQTRILESAAIPFSRPSSWPMDQTWVSHITCRFFMVWTTREAVCVFSCLVMPDSLQPHGLQPIRLLWPWDFPGKDTGVVCHFLLWGIFPTHWLNLGLLHCRQILYQVSYQGSQHSIKYVKGIRAKHTLRCLYNTEIHKSWKENDEQEL